jgi:hypothetical protein
MTTTANVGQPPSAVQPGKARLSGSRNRPMLRKNNAWAIADRSYRIFSRQNYSRKRSGKRSSLHPPYRSIGPRICPARIANTGELWLGIVRGSSFHHGFAAAFLYGTRQPRSLGGCVGVACLSTALLGAALLALAFEGVICIIMAAPLALPLAAFGGSCAYAVQRHRWLRNDAPVFLSALLLFVPGVEWIEHAVAALAPVFVVRTAIEIPATPEQVWKQVVAFSEIPSPREWMFRAGIAYPIRAEIRGTGPGAE